MPIAWRLRIKKGVHLGYRVRYCFAPGPPILPFSCWLLPQDSWMNYLEVIVHFRYLILPSVAPRAYMFDMEKDEVP